MKKTPLLILAAASAVSLVMPACTTYRRSMTPEEKIIARYEQNIIFDGEDPHTFKKVCKHTFADIITLGFAEFWYANVRNSYADVMYEREELKKAYEKLMREREEFRKRFIGKPRSYVVQEYGEPEKIYKDHDVGEILIYQNSEKIQTVQETMGFRAFGNFYDVYGSASVNAKGSESIKFTSVEFYVNKERIVTDVRFRERKKALDHGSPETR